MSKSSAAKQLQYEVGQEVRNSDGTEWIIVHAGASKQKWLITSTCGKERWLTKSRLKKYYKLIPHGES